MVIWGCKIRYFFSFLIFVFVSQAYANQCCRLVTLLEKSSKEKLRPIGLITDSKIKKNFLNKFGTNLSPTENYYVYISKEHGNGAGNYEINKIETNNNKITLDINYVIKPLEIGAAVMNQRILFFRVQPNCKIIEVILSDQSQK